MTEQRTLISWEQLVKAVEMPANAEYPQMWGEDETAPEVFMQVVVSQDGEDGVVQLSKKVWRHMLEKTTPKPRDLN